MSFFGYTMSRDDTDPIDPPSECASCDEGDPVDECPKSKRPCGHHCNHIWSHNICCWCGSIEDEAPYPGGGS